MKTVNTQQVCRCSDREWNKAYYLLDTSFMDSLKPAQGKGLPCNLSLQDHNTPNEELVAVELLHHKCKQAKANYVFVGNYPHKLAVI